MSREWRERLAVVLVVILTTAVAATLALLTEWPRYETPTFPEPWR